MKILSICKALLILIALISIVKVESIEFQVGGDKGWLIPPSKNTGLYNDWASKNRFNVNDSLRFEYKKDSVLVVTKEEYEKCKSTHPMFFSNNGDTIFELDRPGLFYFISGVSGHCERGLKMIVKVLEPENLPQTANETAKSGAAAALVRMDGAVSSTTVVKFIGVVSFLGAILM